MEFDQDTISNPPAPLSEAKPKRSSKENELGKHIRLVFGKKELKGENLSVNELSGHLEGWAGVPRRVDERKEAIALYLTQNSQIFYPHPYDRKTTDKYEARWNTTEFMTKKSLESL